MNATAKQLALVGLVLVGAASLGACRGGISQKPPVHLVLDMDYQQKLKAQMAIAFPYWEDSRAMRTPPPGTVTWNGLGEDTLSAYQDVDGNYLDNPVPAEPDVLARGQERYDIFCAVCHDRSGSGKGLVLQRAQLVSRASFNFQVPDLGKEPRLVEAKDGYLYQVITHGQATMPAYAHQIPVFDRWAIVHYLRALQNRFQ